MLDIEAACKSFLGGRVHVLEGVSLKIAPGEFVAVQGPSGCGKSTLLLSAGGLLPLDRGRVRVNGTELYSLSQGKRADFRAATMGFVFQRFHLVPYLSVLDNVLAPSLTLHIPDARARSEELIARFGLRKRQSHVPSELSTGERQRVAMARALLNSPKLLLADEPTGNLDPDNGQIILNSLADFARSGGAVMLVTHDPRATKVAHRVFAMPMRQDNGP